MRSIKSKQHKNMEMILSAPNQKWYQQRKGLARLPILVSSKGVDLSIMA
jgi:hypothetical protein